MIGEFDIAGVFIPAVLVWAIVAIMLRAILTRVLTALRFYRLVWHRGLFDVATLVILWAAVVAVAAAQRLVQP